MYTAIRGDNHSNSVARMTSHDLEDTNHASAIHATRALTKMANNRIMSLPGDMQEPPKALSSEPYRWDDSPRRAPLADTCRGLAPVYHGKRLAQSPHHLRFQLLFVTSVPCRLSSLHNRFILYTTMSMYTRFTNLCVQDTNSFVYDRGNVTPSDLAQLTTQLESSH